MSNTYVNKVQKSNGEVLIDISDSTAVASDVAQGKYFYLATGEKVAGTSTGGGGGHVTQDQNGYIILPSTGGGGGGSTPSATQHVIHLEFSDSTDTDIDVYYDDSFISTMITSYTPSTYGQKTITLAELDGTAWYAPAAIPLNTQLIDFTAIHSGYAIDNGVEQASQWSCCSDYTRIDPSMTFDYIGYEWYGIYFYDESKQYLNSYIYMHEDATTITSGYAHGTLTPAKIPASAAYVRISSYPNQVDDTMLSLKRTA